MKIIQKIRQRFARSYLLEQHNLLHRISKQVNLSNARSVALLYFLKDEAEYKKAEAILARINDMGIKTRVVCYTDLKITPHYFIPKITQDIITSKDVNWRFQPDKPFVEEFVKTEFDILIDLSIEDYLPLYFLASLSRASLKVGKYREDNQHAYDLMIHTQENETIESFAEQVIHYLNKINR